MSALCATYPQIFSSQRSIVHNNNDSFDAYILRSLEPYLLIKKDTELLLLNKNGLKQITLIKENKQSE